MKTLLNKKVLIVSLTIIAIFTLTIVVNSLSSIEEFKFSGIVNTQKLNVRQGPGIEYSVIGCLNKGDNVNIIGKMDDWYILQTPNNTIGLCSKEYIINAEDSSKVTQMFDLINKQRKEAGVQILKLDSKLCEVAQLKAEDMVNNNYFEHESPIYGSPFDMIKSNGIEYMTAGENIAGYTNVEGSVDAWMKSEGHKNNILSNGYNYTGIGIAKSDKYGYIFVQMFIGKYES